MNSSFPKILYISDVPVEYSSAGGLFMYKLFEGYPADRLVIVQTKPSSSDLMLKGVRYEIINKKWLARLLRTRAHKIALIMEYIIDQFTPRSIKNIIREYKPDAIVTVTHRLYWMIAFRLAKNEKLPLHLVLHDDFIGLDFGKFLFEAQLKKTFQKAYKFASGKYCISPFMERHYFLKFKVGGTVLLPFAGKNDHRLSVSDLSFDDKKTLNFCYAGSLYVGDYLPMLNIFAKALEEKGYKLFVFATFDQDVINSYEHLRKPHVAFNNFESREKVNEFIARNVDVNILLNSFQHDALSLLNFPSKLADYCLVPVPVIFWGRESSGLIRWARQTEYDCLILDLEIQSVIEIVTRLSNLDYRKQLAEQVYSAGVNQFSFERNFEIFKKGLIVELES